MLKYCGAGIVTLFFLTLAGCRTSHEIEVKPVEIKPIHITRKKSRFFEITNFKKAACMNLNKPTGESMPAATRHQSS